LDGLSVLLTDNAKADLLYAVKTLNLGNQVKVYREAQNWTQTEMALRVGMSQSQLSKIEKGRAEPNMRTVKKIAKALQLYPSIELIQFHKLVSRAEAFRAATRQNKIDEAFPEGQGMGTSLW
jgi:transcriptional regulator with XRE-family HTH domain